MDIDSLLGLARWKILEIIAIQPSSPLEISTKLNTSVAYVSQQLKLLEAAGIIKKEKTGEASKGKPRNLYSISNEMIYITSLSNGNPKKVSLKLSANQKITVNIWGSPDSNLHYILEKIFWEIESELSDIKGIFLDLSKHKKKVLFITDTIRLKSKILSLGKNYSSLIDITVTAFNSKEDFSTLYPIYDPLYLTKVRKNVKGGGD